jgi:DNA-directed RNA polymerase delta subunit
VVNSDPTQSTFRKRTQTKTAREVRAEAAERRLLQMGPLKDDQDEAASDHDADAQTDQLAAELDEWSEAERENGKDLNESGVENASDTDEEEHKFELSSKAGRPYPPAN